MFNSQYSVADLEGGKGAIAPPPPSPVKISHTKDGHQRQLRRFHVSCPSPHPTAGSAITVENIIMTRTIFDNEMKQDENEALGKIMKLIFFIFFQIQYICAVFLTI